MRFTGALATLSSFLRREASYEAACLVGGESGACVQEPHTPWLDRKISRACPVQCGCDVRWSVQPWTAVLF